MLWLILLPFKSSQSTVARYTLLLGTTLGLFTVIFQGKDYPYHRYPLLAFLLPLVAHDLDDLLHRRSGSNLTRWPSHLAAAAFLAAAVFLGGTSALVTGRLNPQMPQFRVSLSNDLLKLAQIHDISSLVGPVQCLDSVEGCVATLNDLHLTQSTGTLYNEFLFHPAGTPAVDESRQRFSQAIETQPPTLFVVTEPLFPDGPNHYAKLDQWPGFTAWLTTRYTLILERSAMPLTRTGGALYYPPGYRIYLRRPH